MAELQRKILTRWVNQKLWNSRHIKVNDIVKDAADPMIFLNLVEVLSEKKFTGKLEKGTMRVQQISSLSNVLKFIYEDCGVVSKMKASPEDLADGNEKNVLGLVFNIFMKFMKFGDEDDPKATSSAKDALLLWVKNKADGYSGIQITTFKDTFNNGLALCALIHKHRPNLIDYDSLQKDDKIGNVKIAMDAAEKYFGLEQYITPQEFLKLDENSMVVYVSEYYYGIAEQRKIDQAAKRILRLVKFTKLCDNLRADYNKQADEFKVHLSKVEKVLGDRTIDNTLAGAQRKMEEFYKYKVEDKGIILGLQLNLEGLFNNLSLLLSQNKRPSFQPQNGLSLKDIQQAILHLEQIEQERKVALTAELNRQLKLVEVNKEHASLCEKYQQWGKVKKEYLSTKEEIESVGQAQFALRTLEATDMEINAVNCSDCQEIKKKSKFLEEQKYEFISDVQAREKAVDDNMITLVSLSQQKKPVLEDDLARELFREKLHLLASQHTDRYNQLQEWIKVKTPFVDERLDLTSSSDAVLQVSLLEAFMKEREDIYNGSFTSLKNLGNEILSAEYKTQYSSYIYENPDEIKDAEAQVEEQFQIITKNAGDKKLYLDDAVARNLFRENLLMKGSQHKDKYNQIINWIKTKEPFAADRLEITSTSQAVVQLSLLEVFVKEKYDMYNGNFESLRKLGNDILTSEYKTNLSSYTYEKVDEIRNDEASIQQEFEELTTKSNEKKLYLDECLVRETNKEKLRIEFAHLSSDYMRWSTSICEAAALTSFGFDLEEVEAFENVIKSMEEESRNLSASKKSYCFTMLRRRKSCWHQRECLY